MKQKNVLFDFLSAWKKGDLKTALGLTQKTWSHTGPEDPETKQPIPRTEKDLEIALLGKKLTGFGIVSFTNVSNVKAQFGVTLEFGKEKVDSVVNLICEEWPFKPSPFGDWGVNPASIMNSYKPVDEPREEPALKNQAGDVVNGDAEVPGPAPKQARKRTPRKTSAKPRKKPANESKK